MSFFSVNPAASAVGTLGVRLPQATTSPIISGPLSGHFFRQPSPAVPAPATHRGRIRSEQARYHVLCRRALAFCPPPLKSW